MAPVASAICGNAEYNAAIAATTSATARHDTASIHHWALVQRAISTVSVPGVATGTSPTLKTNGICTRPFVS